MKRVLLVDTNFSSAPIHDYLVASGYEVFLVGRSPNDFLAKALPGYIQLDYSDINGLRQKIEEYNIDYIVPGCNDLSYEVCSILNETGCYPGIDQIGVSRTLNHKAAFRQFAEQEQLPTPGLVNDSVGADLSKCSVVVKPVDAFSGKGVSILHCPNPQQYQKAVIKAKQASRSDEYLVEGFVEGQLYSHSAFITGGKIGIDFMVVEYCKVNPLVVDTSLVASRFPDAIRHAIRSVIEKIARCLNLADGLVHTQLICNGKDFWLIEMTRRCPGDLYSLLIELTTSFPYVEHYVCPFIDSTPRNFKRDEFYRPIVRQTITQSSNCALFAVDFASAHRIVKFVPIAQVGDWLSPSPGGRVGIAFYETSLEELHADFRPDEKLSYIRSFAASSESADPS